MEPKRPLPTGAVSREEGPSTLSPCSPHLTPNGEVGAHSQEGVQHSRIDRALAFCPEAGAGGAGCDTQCWEVLGRLQRKEELGQVDPFAAVHKPLGLILCCVGVDLSQKDTEDTEN